jgi:hypothetical protein
MFLGAGLPLLLRPCMSHDRIATVSRFRVVAFVGNVAIIQGRVSRNSLLLERRWARMGEGHFEPVRANFSQTDHRRPVSRDKRHGHPQGLYFLIDVISAPLRRCVTFEARRNEVCMTPLRELIA